MTAELVEFRFEEPAVVTGADTARIEFDEPVFVLAVHAIGPEWSSNDATWTLGTGDRPDLFCRGRATRGIKATVLDESLIVAEPVSELVAQMSPGVSRAGRGHLRLRVLVAAPRIVEAS